MFLKLKLKPILK